MITLLKITLAKIILVKITQCRAGAGRLQQRLGSLLGCHLAAAAIPQHGVHRVPGCRDRRSHTLQPRQVGKRVGSGRHDVIVPRRPGL